MSCARGPYAALPSCECQRSRPTQPEPAEFASSITKGGGSTAEPRGSHELIFRSSVAERARAIPNAATLFGHGCPEAGKDSASPLAAL
jgi:hypothetical protein